MTRLPRVVVVAAATVGGAFFFGGCGLLGGECADCALLPQPLGVDGAQASSELLTAAPGALRWVRNGLDDDTLVVDGADVVTLERAAVTHALVALRVPDDLAVGTVGVVGGRSGLAVSIGPPLIDVDDTALEPVVRASSIAGCASACSTTFDPQAHPTPLAAPALAVELDASFANAVALDMWERDDDDVSDLDDRAVDTAIVADGFDQSFFQAFRASTLTVPVAAGAYAVRLRRLSDTAVGAVSVVVVE